MNFLKRNAGPIVVSLILSMGIVACGTPHTGPKRTDAAPVTRAERTLSKQRDAIVKRAYADCDGLSLRHFRPCLALAVVPASEHANPDGSKISTPDGTALVRECLSQYAGTELDACLIHSGQDN